MVTYMSIVSTDISSALDIESVSTDVGKTFRQYNNKIPRLLRYPGGKRRLIPFLARFLPQSQDILGRYMDPFVGSASVFFFLQPRRALISDLNPELIELYLALKEDPFGIWEAYKSMPSDKDGYYAIRAEDPSTLDPSQRAARLLYLNRTCFKGMWRHNKKGQFNIGYGGQSRRWVVTQSELVEVSHRLNNVDIRCLDFQPVIEEAQGGDFIFLDPPYKPGSNQMNNAHYIGQIFKYSDQERLALSLKNASKRDVPWLLTNSAHEDILRLYCGNYFVPLTIGTGKRPGILSSSSNEVVIFNDSTASKYLYLPASSVSML